jgi:hypothetical protein
MSRALHEPSAADKRVTGPAAPPARGIWRRAIDRILRRKPARTPDTFGGLTYEEFGKFAAESPPPRAWHEQDVKGLRGPNP